MNSQEVNGLSLDTATAIAEQIETQNKMGVKLGEGALGVIALCTIIENELKLMRSAVIEKHLHEADLHSMRIAAYLCRYSQNTLRGDSPCK